MRLHARDRCGDHTEHAIEIDAKRGLPLLRRHRIDGLLVRRPHPVVYDHNVRRAEDLRRLIDECLPIRHAAQLLLHGPADILAATLLFATAAAIAQTEKPSVEVTGDHLEQTARCDKDAPLRILSNDSRLSVLGTCTVVTIVGSRNWISIQHARRILTTGDRNTVLYDDRSTRVEDHGRANSVAERWPQ